MKQFIGTALMGAVAISLIAYEWDSRRHARAGRAVVIESAVYGRSGKTIADVVHVVGGQQVRATLRAWYCHLKPGQQLRILYRPSDPEDVVLDSFWQRHYGSMVALALFVIVAIGEILAQAMKDARERRQQALMLLRDDYLVPRESGSRAAASLRIDTSPRLWDRELDG
jgi:putative exporter of polyketide antibiotics